MMRHSLIPIFTCVTLAVAAQTHPTMTAQTAAAALQIGSSNVRLAVLKSLLSGDTRLEGDFSDDVLDSLEQCAADPNPKLRAAAGLMVGVRWIQWVQSHHPPSSPATLAKAIAIEAKLALDPDPDVRHDAVAAGLKNVADKDNVTVAALVDSVMRPSEWDDWVAAQAILGLNGACGGKVDAARLIPLLEPYWANHVTDPDRAAAAYVMYVGATGQEPPGAERLAGVGHFNLAITARAGADTDDIRADLKARLSAGMVKALSFQQSHGQVWGTLAIDGVANRSMVVQALRHSHVLNVPDDMSQWGPVLFTHAQYAKFIDDAAHPKPTTTPTTPSDYAAAFQDLYDHIAKTYPEFQMKGIDWSAVGKELLPRAKGVRNDGQFGLLVQELVARLKDSHAVVEAAADEVPSPDLPDWDPGFACLDDDHDQPAVYTVEPDSPAAKAGIRIGHTIIKINGIAAEDAVQARMRLLQRYFGYSSQRILRYDAIRNFAAQDDEGTIVHLTIQNVDGHSSNVDVSATCQSRYLPRLPLPRAHIIDIADCSSTMLQPGIGYIYVRRISNSLNANLDTALRSLGPIRGLMIDVRGNSGGGFDADSAFANFDPQEKRWPERPRYTGPIALLTDERTISAGEGWASWFMAKHRARFFGSTTAGASSRKEVYTLSNGLFKVVIPVKPYTGFLDRPIECQGLPPDVPIRCSAKDLAAGRDTVIEAALRWLSDKPQ